MRQSSHNSPGRWIAIAVAISIALFTSFGAFAQERLVVDRLGDPSGKTIVFVPGLGTPGSVFQPYAISRADLDAHLVTLAGFGGVPAVDPADGVIAPGAQALAEYLEAQALSEVVLVGHSLGGQVALQAARFAPGRVDQVVVVDSVPFFPALMQPDADPAVAQAQGQAMKAMFAGMERAAFLAMIEQGAPRQATSPEHQALVVEYVAQSDQFTVAQGTYEALSMDWRPGLSAVDAPVTVLVPHNAFLGMPPEAVSARYAAQYEAIEALEVHVVSDSRHFIMLDQPEAFGSALAEIVGAPS